jgi:hypothetical protein
MVVKVYVRIMQLYVHYFAVKQLSSKELQPRNASVPLPFYL